MKSSTIICLALTVALCIVTWRLVSGSATDTTVTSDSISANPAYDCIMTRSSCRAFTDARPSEGQIDSLLHAGMAAPSACNQQAWSFVVITDRDVLDSIAANCRNIKMAAQAPLAIAVCGDVTVAREKKGIDFLDQDLSAATENILLAARSMGLGAVWCGIYPEEDRVKFIRELLELPDSIIPLNIIPIGVPASPLSPKDKWNAEKVHYNSY